MNARLRNEFVGDAPDAAKSREKAFDAYNTLVDQEPGHAVRLLGDLAAKRAFLEATYADDDNTLPAATWRVLKVTNYGEQIGFVSADAPWGSIFADPEYTKARHHVKELPYAEKDTPEGIARRQHRALQVLSVAVKIVENESHIRTNLSSAA